MRIFGKKALAITLTLAMLLSCMVFSFSASADVSLMVKNDYNDGSDTNWLSKYGPTSASNANNSKNYAEYYDDEGNGTMKVGFGKGGEGAMSGYWFFANGGNYHDGATGAMTTFGNATYKITLRYKVLSFYEGDVNAQVDLVFGLAPRYAFYYDGGENSRTFNTHFLNNGGVYTVADTVDASDVDAGWQEVTTYLNLTTAAAAEYRAHVIAKIGGGYQNSLEGTEILIDDVYVYKYDDAAEIDEDLNIFATKMWENDFDRIPEAAGSNWANYFYSGYTNQNDTWRANFHSDPVKATAGNYAMLEDGAMKIGFGTNENAESAYISAFYLKHQFATTPKTGANDFTYGDSGDNTSGGNPAGTKYGDFVPQAGKYVIKFDYKVTSFNQESNSSVDLKIGYNASTVFLDGNKYQSQWAGNTTILTVDKTDVSDEWKTAYAFIDSPGGHAGGWIVFAKVANNSESDLTNCEILFDNYVIYSYTDMPTISIHNGDNVIAVEGVPGTAFDADAALNAAAGVEVTYYADAGLTEEIAAPTAFTNADVDVYVSIEGPWSFESEAMGTLDGITFHDIAGASVDNVYAHSGNQSLRVTVGASTKGNRLEIPVRDVTGQQVAVETGKNYIFSFWAYVPEDQSDFNLHFWLAAENTTNVSDASGSKMMYNDWIWDDGTDNVNVITPGSGWQQITVYAKARVSSPMVRMGIASNGTTDKRIMYIDDVTMTEVGELTNGEDHAVYMYDNNGSYLHTNTNTGEGEFTSVRLGATYESTGIVGDDIVIGGVAYKLKERGILVDTAANVAANGLDVDNKKWSSSKTTGFNDYWETNGSAEAPTANSDITYTLCLANMSKDWFVNNAEYQYRSYYVFEVPYRYQKASMSGNQTVIVYGDLSDTFTFNDLHEAAESVNNYGADAWFK